MDSSKNNKPCSANPTKNRKTLLRVINGLALTLIASVGVLLPISPAKAEKPKTERAGSPLTLLSDEIDDLGDNRTEDDMEFIKILQEQRLAQNKKIKILRKELESTKSRLEMLKSDLMVKGYSAEKVLKNRIQSLEDELLKIKDETSNLTSAIVSKEEALETKKHELHAATTIFMETSSRLNEQLRNAENQIVAINHQLTIANERLLEKDAELQIAHSWQEDLSHAETKIKEMQKHLERAESLYRQEKNKADLLTEALQEHSFTRRELENKYAELEKTLEQEKVEALYLVEALESNIQNLEHKEDQVNSSIYDLTVRLHQVELKGADLKKDLLSAKKNYIAENEKQTSLHQNLTQELKEKDSLSKEYLTTFQISILNLEDQLEAAKMRIRELEALKEKADSADGFQLSLAEKEKELKDLSHKLQEEIRNTSSLQSELEAANDLHASEKDELLKGIQAHRKELEEAKTDLKLLSEQFSAMTGIFDHFEEGVRSKISEMENQIHFFENESKKEEAWRKHLEAKLEEKEKELLNFAFLFETREEELKEAIAQKEKELETEQSQTSDLELYLMEAKEELASLQENQRQIHTEKEEFQKEIHLAKIRIDDSQEVITYLRNELNDTLSHLEEERNLTGRLKNELAQNEESQKKHQETVDYVAELEFLLDQTDITIHEEREQILALKETLTKALDEKKHLEASLDQYENAKAKLNHLEIALNEASESTKAMGSQTTSLREQLEEAQKEKEVLRASLEEFERYRNHANELQEALSKANTALDENSSQIQLLKDELSKTLDFQNVLNEKYEASLRELDHAKQNLAKEELESNELKNRLDDLALKQTEANNVSVALRNDLERSYALQESEREEAKKKLDELEETLRNQEREKSNADDLIRHLKEELQKEEAEKIEAQQLVLKLKDMQELYHLEKDKTESLLTKIQEIEMEKNQEVLKNRAMMEHLAEVMDENEHSKRGISHLEDQLKNLTAIEMEKNQELEKNNSLMQRLNAAMEEVEYSKNYAEELEERYKSLSSIEMEKNQEMQRNHALMQQLHDAMEELEHSKSHTQELEEKFSRFSSLEIEKNQELERNQILIQKLTEAMEELEKARSDQQALVSKINYLAEEERNSKLLAAKVIDNFESALNELSIEENTSRSLRNSYDDLLMSYQIEIEKNQEQNQRLQDLRNQNEDLIREINKEREITFQLRSEQNRPFFHDEEFNQ